MHYAEYPAPPPLDAVVHCFWFLSGDDLGGQQHVVVADGRPEIVLHFGEPFARVDAGRARVQDRALVSGQLSAPLRLQVRGPADVVGIRFRTSAAAALFRAPLDQLADRVDALSDWSPSLAAALYDAGASVADATGRRAALGAVLERFITGEPDPLAGAVVRALDVPLAPQVARVADTFGMSARTLERRVRAATGLAPAPLRRVLRFRRVFRMMSAEPPGAWGHLALRAGFYDQSHFIRDFRQFAGAPPSEFFRANPELARALLAAE